MAKVPVAVTNDLCPQTLFLYGTYKDDGKPNFGLFCWFSYCFDGELEIMACIGGDKLTKELIIKNRVFSANLVTENILPLADWYGTHNGNDIDKSTVNTAVERGQVLNVPVLKDSPWAYELEVGREIETDDGLILLCKIRNVLCDEELQKDGETLQGTVTVAKPVRTCKTTYYGWDGHAMGAWGEPGKTIAE